MKNKEKAPSVRRCSVGGQAVMEGVMMKSDVGIAMAVRRADGSIVKHYTKYRSKAQKGTFWGLPVVRGMVAFVESLKTGMDTTTKSAELLGESFEEEPSKFEKWLADKLHVDIMDAVMGVGIVLGLALAVGLFMFLPQFVASLIFGKAAAGADRFYIWRSLLEGLLRLAIYVGYLFAVSGIKDIKRVFMYHGAEHKTIACYESGEDDLTPEKAMKFKRLHPRCGTNYLFLVMAISIIVLTIADIIMHSLGFPGAEMKRGVAFLIRFGVRILLLPLIAGVSYEVLRAAAKTDNWFTKAVRAPGMALQLITTKEPDLDMLEVAIYSFYLAMGQKNPLEERKLAEEAAKAAAAAVTIDAPADPERGGEEAAESEAAPEAPEAPEAGEAPAEENR